MPIVALVIRAVHREFKDELIVTENGIATSDDSRRVEFIRRAAAGVQSCINDNIPVKGIVCGQDLQYNGIISM